MIICEVGSYAVVSPAIVVCLVTGLADTDKAGLAGSALGAGVAGLLWLVSLQVGRSVGEWYNF